MSLNKPVSETAAVGAEAEGMARAFAQRFGRPPARFYRAPGRVNVIGEHTDYNAGWVMPAAIDLAVRIAIAPRSDRRGRLASAQFDAIASFDFNGGEAAVPRWARSLAGVARLLEAGHGPLRGADVFIDSQIPVGAGLSSSAALDVGFGYALAAVNGITVDPTALALLCQRASHEFGATRCGIMDFYIACHGRAGQVVELDTRTLDARWWPWPEQLSLVACDTGRSHDNATSGYNQRRAECEAAVERLQQWLPQLRALRDLNAADLDRYAPQLDPTLAARCRHVVSENARVAAAAAALAAGDFVRLGELVDASHRSLRDDYQVSCRELDLMVEICRRQPGVYGARMMGGGFGGCALALAAPAAVPELRRRVMREYPPATGLAPEVWACTPAAGVGAWAIGESATRDGVDAGTTL